MSHGSDLQQGIYHNDGVISHGLAQTCSRGFTIMILNRTGKQCISGSTHFAIPSATDAVYGKTTLFKFEDFLGVHTVVDLRFS